MTGARGLVGRALVDQAVTAHTPLRALSRAGGPARDGVDWVTGDLRRGVGAAALSGVQTVVHLAAQTGAAAPEAYAEVNVEGTRALLEAARTAGVRRFVFVSSIAVRFSSIADYPYAASKLEAERLVRASALEWVIVRPTLILGRGAPNLDKLAGLACLPMVPLPGGGKVRLQPVDVRDLAAVLLLAEQMPAGQVLEVGGPQTVSMADLFRRIRVVKGKGGAPRLPIPLAPLRLMAGLLRAVLGDRSPVTAAQLSSFVEDAVAEPHPWVADRMAGFRDLDTTLRDALA